MSNEKCDGFQLSNCCGAIIYANTDICSDCKEHCETQCVDWVEPCENKTTMEDSLYA